MNFKAWFFEKHLMEMPLTHYSVNTDTGFDIRRRIDKSKKIKNNDVSGYFSFLDNIVLNRPKTIKIIEDKLKKIGYNINIILYEPITKKINNPLLTQLPPSRRSNFDDYKKNVQDYMIKNNIKKEGHITFVKNSSSGDPLSPWMILHTLGHAVSSELGVQKLADQILPCLKGTLKSGEYWPPENDPNSLEGMLTLKDLFKFKSSQSKTNLLDFDELMHELFAEYLWHGKIRANPNYYLASGLKEKTGIDVSKCLENIIKKSLDSVVGKVIYDFTQG